MRYNLSNQGSNGSLSVFFADGENKVLANTHPNFVATVTYLVGQEAAGQPHDEEHVRGLVDPTVGIGRMLQEAFGDRVTFDLYHLYLDGIKMEGALANFIKQRLNSGDPDWARFLRFLVNLEANPSKRAKEAVWTWVEGNGLTITEDGRFLGYKAVQEDGMSSHAGPNNFVNGVLLNNGDVSRVPHEVGSVISKRRADVDDTPGGGCSVGLHVGTLAYAKGFAPRLMTVLVNPAHVVSAPGHELSFKIRVHEYEVHSLADPKQFSGQSYDVRTEEVTAEELRKATEEPVRSASHVWTGKQQAEYDSLRASGRTLYDNLRTQFGKSHDAAYTAAVQTFGRKPESIERELRQRDLFGLTDDQHAQYVARRRDGDDHETALATVVAEPEQDVADAAENDIQAPSPDLTLAANAALVPDLKRDLEDKTLGHKPLARKWENLTTESSVRRYRKANGIQVEFKARMRDALS